MSRRIIFGLIFLDLKCLYSQCVKSYFFHDIFKGNYHQKMSCNACLFWASYNFILWYYYCSLLLLSLFISEFEIWSIMYCSVFILFLLVVFSLSLNFWNSSQPILFGGMLMPKFAALSNHTTWKCQRRKGKRCRIPKVKILPVITTNQKSVITTKTNKSEYSILLISASCSIFYFMCSVFAKQNVKAFRKELYKRIAAWPKKKEETMKNETFFFSEIV